jgi:mono/diheme cytochrome c family protein
MMGHSSMQRRRQAMMAGVPVPYRGMVDPLPSSPAVIAAGKDSYGVHCAVCHGAEGEGDGAAGSALSPPPANLRALLHSPTARDDYLMWAISSGGAEFGTGMPAFKDALPEDARWKIVRYLRTL